MQVISINREQVVKQIANIFFKNGDRLIDNISEIIVKGTNIGFAINIKNHDRQEAEEIRDKAAKQLQEINNIGKITIVLTSDSYNADNKPPTTSTKEQPKHLIDNVKNVILIAGGKGGIGKSTVTALIAENLNAKGYKIGIADADIYGPSMPQIFGINQSPQIIDKKFSPIICRNIQIMSIGFLIPNNNPISWRGPMASKAIYQLLSLTNWSEIDYLFIDMPPGTGDIHLSILQNYLIRGAIIITTPQKIAKIDVVKTIELYNKFNISLLGIIENMSHFNSPSSAYNIALFPGNSGAELATEYQIPLIQKIPLLPKLADACDKGATLNNIIELEIEQYLR